MKKLFYILLAPVVLSLGACNMADDSDYENMANDICDCVNKNTDGISEGMKTAIVDAVNSGKNVETAIQEIAMEDPAQAMKDAEEMMGLEAGMTKCGEDLEKKYENVYSSDTEAEVQKKLVETLKKNKSCAFTYAMYKLGTQMQ
ncbi:MAG: hypothetical protein A3D31_03475 [Candidatus Fluviicola riflensis]|nr:MAG: hypothetical protein CHH17_11555 [Candidatus Fluviicola riflensis]OGS79039.1 MAG: hypothetical protein A3D31_03475 [Candidatus Fluviicola riflensis]OGS86062.1 MAG: hypothetical protein A3E30_10965 [Fluviicola sp. RIFCSPHIGHO2_12_FULL_43_24]OGS86471.1 MAG: hypothetical protein A2724_02935 [Fluviicola sp. RIFCSPHIGHO2_01_FULL_43_53]